MSRILVVEDEIEILDLLEKGLKRHNFEIEVSRDGRDAIEKVESFSPDIVILDIMIPELDGVSVLKWVKEHYPHVKVIMATAKDEIEDIKNGFQSKADYYITKPYVFDEIIKSVQILQELSSE